MEEMKFVKIPWKYGKESPVKTIDGFTNLGDFRDENVTSATVTPNGEYQMFDKCFLVIVDDNYFQIRVKKPEDIFIFLQDKDWYSKKTTCLLIFQLYSEWVYSDVDNELWGEERDETGFHPLDHKKAVKQIFSSLNDLLNFKLENTSVVEQEKK